MKNFWKKYKGLVIGIVGVLAFMSLSLLGESAGKEEKSSEPSADLSTWTEAVNKDEYVVTVIGLSYCSHCQDYYPVLNRLAEENGFQTYWFDIDELESSDQTVLTSTYDFSEYTGSSPYTAVTKNGEVLAQTVGFGGEDSIKEFFKENGLIK